MVASTTEVPLWADCEVLWAPSAAIWQFWAIFPEVVVISSPAAATEFACVSTCSEPRAIRLAVSFNWLAAAATRTEVSETRLMVARRLWAMAWKEDASCPISSSEPEDIATLNSPSAILLVCLTKAATGTVMVREMRKVRMMVSANMRANATASPILILFICSATSSR